MKSSSTILTVNEGSPTPCLRLALNKNGLATVSLLDDDGREKFAIECDEGGMLEMKPSADRLR